MCKKIYKLLFSCIGVVLAFVSGAQPAGSGGEKAPEMADAMRSNGKIYVVIAVVLTILLGLLLYLIRLDKKIGKLEKEN